MADQDLDLYMSQKYDPSTYPTMHYKDFDVVIDDISEEKLEWIGDQRGVKHLSATTFPTPPFPVKGYIDGYNFRFMVPLVVRRFGWPESTPVQVWFLCDPASPFTCLTFKTLEALHGPGNIVDYSVDKNDPKNYTNFVMAIQDQKIHIECKISKAHYKQVNILGVNAMRKLRLSIDVDWRTKTFMLIQKKFVI